MDRIPEDLHHRLKHHEQDHVFAFWDQLTPQERSALLEQLRALNLEQLRDLFSQRDKGQAVPHHDEIHPIPFIPAEHPENRERKSRGEHALRSGEVAVLVVAGGQGSRLGFDQPKGMYPVGPVSRKTLFHYHGEKVAALSRRFKKPIPFLIMTSSATHDETIAFFEEEKYFGLPREHVHFFQQGSMPALDLHTGKLLLDAPGQLFLSPDGHGGTLTALASSGLLRRMKDQGIRHIFYFQVDNPMVRIADPTFIGHHAAAQAEVSSKVVSKRGPKEKMGVFAKVQGRCNIVEYSDLPDELAHATDDEGRLRLWAGNPAIHLFDVAFLERMTDNLEHLPFHVAKKKVPHIDSTGQVVEPAKENALKFERFIFDVLPAADRWTVVETTREEEFSPLKNAEGADSPATVEQSLVDQAVRWIQQAGGQVPLRDDGSPAIKVEISPLHALDIEELVEKLPPGHRIDRDIYLGH